MTSRQARRERREAERKSKKAEIKRLKAEHLDGGFVRQNASTGEIGGFVSQIAEAPRPATQFVRQSAPSVRPLPQDATARAEINRQNAQHSTGPRSSAGKLASSRNSLKHGLASSELIIPGEDCAAYDALLNILLEEHQPANATEELLVQQIARSYWLEQRAIRLQNECFTDQGVDDKRLSLFLRYQTTHNRAFHKALDALFRLKQSRARERGVAACEEATFLSQPKTPKNGFLSQNSHFVRQNSPPDRFVSQNAEASGLGHHQKAA